MKLMPLKSLFNLSAESLKDIRVFNFPFALDYTALNHVKFY